jgi:2'-5' RNA ligase
VNSVRSFIALELNPDVVAALLGAGAALRSAAPAWSSEKWIPQENLHVTLKFLGDIAEGEIPDLKLQLEPVLARLQTFRLDLAGVAAVPTARRCTLVWATLTDSRDAYVALAEQVDDVAARFGCERETRAFKPHVTLVRARHPRYLHSEALACANAALPDSPLSMSVPSATLFASTLTRQGAIYESLARWEFSSVR